MSNKTDWSKFDWLWESAGYGFVFMLVFNFTALVGRDLLVWMMERGGVVYYSLMFLVGIAIRWWRNEIKKR